MTSDYKVRLRPLEREDLRFVHQLDNNASVMRYWFEEPYEAFVELSDLYDKHIHDQSERRFVVECDGENAGLVELVEINHVHRRAEFQIIISPEYQGKGLASRAAKLAMDYGTPMVPTTATAHPISKTVNWWSCSAIIRLKHA